MKAGDKGLEGTMPAQAGRFRAQDQGLLPHRPRSSGPVELGLGSKAGWMAASESILCAVGEAEDGILGMVGVDIQKMSFEATVKSKSVSKFGPNHPSYVATMIIFSSQIKVVIVFC